MKQQFIDYIRRLDIFCEEIDADFSDPLLLMTITKFRNFTLMKPKTILFFLQENAVYAKRICLQGFAKIYFCAA